MFVYALPTAPMPMYQVPLGFAADTQRKDSADWEGMAPSASSAQDRSTVLRKWCIHVLQKVRGGQKTPFKQAVAVRGRLRPD